MTGGHERECFDEWYVAVVQYLLKSYIYAARPCSTYVPLLSVAQVAASVERLRDSLDDRRLL